MEPDRKETASAAQHGSLIIERIDLGITAAKGLKSSLRILSFTEEASELEAKILSGLEKAGRAMVG